MAISDPTIFQLILTRTPIKNKDMALRQTVLDDNKIYYDYIVASGVNKHDQSEAEQLIPYSQEQILVKKIFDALKRQNLVKVKARGDTLSPSQTLNQLRGHSRSSLN